MTIQHIALEGEWRAAQGEGFYRTSTIGMSIAQVGYLHASLPEQVAATRSRFYADAGPLVLLTLDEDALARHGFEVRFEPAVPGDPTSERFPHVYGGDLPIDVVREARQLD